MKLIKTNEPIIIKNNNYKQCVLYLLYPIKKINDLEKKILENVILKKSKIYNTPKKVRNAQIKNNCIFFNYKILVIGNSYFLEIMLIYPSAKAIKKDVLKDNLLFVRDMINNPILKDGLFDPNDINELKEIFKKSVKKIFDDSFLYYNYQNDKLIDEDDFLKNEFIEDNSIIDKITPKTITKLYFDIINNKPMTFLFGDVSNHDKNVILENLFDNQIEKIEFEKEYTHYFTDIPKKVIVKEDITNYETSLIYYNFKLVNPNILDRKFLLTINNLLNSNNSMPLFDKLRLENNLVYRCGVRTSKSILTLTIWASTSKNNIDKVKSEINEVLKMTFSKEYINNHLEKIKEDMKIGYILNKENIDGILFDKVDRYIEFKDKTYYEELCELKADDIYNFINNKLKLTSIYIGVGKGEY